MRHRILLALGCLVCSCAETGQDRVAIPLFVTGTEMSEPILTAGDVPVTLERADLAFGPLYLCAGSQAGHLCDTARLEWLESVVVDVIDPTPQRAGDLVGVTGSVRSWMYDLGISSQLTRGEPFVLEAAHELGGVSLVLSGRADVNGIELPFSAAVPIQQEEQTEIGVPVVRRSASDIFAHDVKIDEPGLGIRFDPEPWVRGIDFRAYIEDASCTAGGPEHVCAGLLEQTCDADGTVASSRDCGALGQACLVRIGCAEQLILEPGSQAFRSVRNALVSGERPAFEWGFSP